MPRNDVRRRNSLIMNQLINDQNENEQTRQHLQFEAVRSLSLLLMQEVNLLERMPGVVENSVKNGTPICLFTELQRFECNLIRSALIRSMGSQTKAARLLNLKLTTLNAKIKHFRIDLMGLKSAA